MLYEVITMIMKFISELVAKGFSDVGVMSAVKTTLIMAISSTIISAVFGIIIGLLLERFNFKGKKIVVRINRTLMGVPPVVIGLVVYMLLMRRGPLGSLHILFTVKGMIFAQVLIITPIVSGMIYSSALKSAMPIRFFAKTMGANSRQTSFLIIKEMRSEIYFALVAGFGRAISEVVITSYSIHYTKLYEGIDGRNSIKFENNNNNKSQIVKLLVSILIVNISNKNQLYFYKIL